MKVHVVDSEQHDSAIEESRMHVCSWSVIIANAFAMRYT